MVEGGSKCYGKKQLKGRSSLLILFPFLHFTSTFSASSPFSLFPSFSPSPPLPVPFPLPLPFSPPAPQSLADRQGGGGAADPVNSPFTCTAGLLQTFLLIFAGLKASPFPLIIP